jgi:hypothetical protein
LLSNSRLLSSLQNFIDRNSHQNCDFFKQSINGCLLMS